MVITKRLNFQKHSKINNMDNKEKIREVLQSIYDNSFDLKRFDQSLIEKIGCIRSMAQYGLTLVKPSPEEIELDLCRSNPVYFIEKYINIRTPNGRIPFVLYDWQKEFINTAQKESRVFVKKPRQVGFTTIQCAYLVWKLLFVKNQSIAVMSCNLISTNAIRDVIYDMMDNCLMDVKSLLCRVNKSNISISNGNTIDFISTSSLGSGVRGKSFSTIFIDECEFINSGIIQCIVPCLYTKGSHFIVGSTSGIHPWTNVLDWSILKVKWNAVPNRDAKWLLDRVREIGVDAVERELI